MRTREKRKIWSKIPTQKPDCQPTPSSVLLIFAPIQLDFLHNERCTALILREEVFKKPHILSAKYEQTR